MYVNTSGFSLFSKYSIITEIAMPVLLFLIQIHNFQGQNIKLIKQCLCIFLL